MKELFPFFSQYPKITYLDSASMTQPPWSVLEATQNFLINGVANPLHNSHSIDMHNAQLLENIREKVAQWTQTNPDNIAFVPSATYASNILALHFARHLSKNDSIFLSPFEHNATYLPWKRVAEQTSSQLEIPKISETNDLILTEKPYTVAIINALSHVTGVPTSHQEIAAWIKKCNPSCAIIVDASQIIEDGSFTCDPHIDAFFFSAHKMYGIAGVGCLWIKQDLLEKMEPILQGGGASNHLNAHKRNKVAEKLTPGTLPMPSIIALGTAIDFIIEHKNTIQDNNRNLLAYLEEGLSTITNLDVIFPKKEKKHLLSFTCPPHHPHDVMMFPSMSNICIRTGWHCAEYQVKIALKQPKGTLRVSLGAYNDRADVDRFIEALECNPLLSPKEKNYAN